MKTYFCWSLLVAAAATVVATTHLLGQVEQERPQRVDRADHDHERAHQHALPRQIPGQIVSTHELMNLFNKPLYEFLQAEMKKEIGENAEWDTIVDRGLQTAEVMNLVALREVDEAQRQQWMNHVVQVQQAGLELAEAAKQQNVDLTRASYQNVIQSCNGCHQTFAPEHAPQLEP